jgi:hypothetical protein
MNESWNRVPAAHSVVLQGSKYACSIGDRKG